MVFIQHLSKDIAEEDEVRLRATEGEVDAFVLPERWRAPKWLLVTATVISTALAAFILVIVPAYMPPARAEGKLNASQPGCPAVTPQTLPASYGPPVSDAGREAFVTSWDELVEATLSRPAGVRPGCEPMRFAARGTYRGVAVLFHGFTSCPQEMALLAPPLAARGYDVLLVLNAGHGDKLAFKHDASYWLWGFLGAALALGVLSLRDCSCVRGCSRRVTRAAGFVARLLLLASVVAIGGVLLHSDHTAVCLSLSHGVGCMSEAERNNDLPITPDGHLALLAEVNRIVALAPGKHVAMGLSLGGNYAAHAAMATVPGGTAPLYERVLIMAPFFQSLGVGPLLTPLHSMGLGALTVDWGVGCDEERRLGRRGYCTMLVDNIRAARDMGGRLFDSPPLRFPTGSHVAYMLVEQAVEHARMAAGGDGPVELCTLSNARGYHSFISTWNNVGVHKWWIPEVVCLAVDFAADGTPLPLAAGAATAADGTPLCEEACTEATCAYECTKESFLRCPAR